MIAILQILSQIELEHWLEIKHPFKNHLFIIKYYYINIIINIKIIIPIHISSF